MAVQDGKYLKKEVTKGMDELFVHYVDHLEKALDEFEDGHDLAMIELLMETEQCLANLNFLLLKNLPPHVGLAFAAQQLEKAAAKQAAKMGDNLPPNINN